MLIKIVAILAMAPIAAIVLIIAGIRKKNRKLVIIPIVVFLVLCALAYWGVTSFLSACSNGLTSRDSIVSLYTQNESLFVNAATNSNFSDLEKIDGVQEVLVWDKYVDIQCGGSGFGSSTNYFGIFFSEKDNLRAIDVAGPFDEFVSSGNGYRCEQPDGDNEYYVEPLGNHYFYYEVHY